MPRTAARAPAHSARRAQRTLRPPMVMNAAIAVASASTTAWQRSESSRYASMYAGARPTWRMRRRSTASAAASPRTLCCRHMLALSSPTRIAKSSARPRLLEDFDISRDAGRCNCARVRGARSIFVRVEKKFPRLH